MNARGYPIGHYENRVYRKTLCPKHVDEKSCISLVGCARRRLQRICLAWVSNREFKIQSLFQCRTFCFIYHHQSRDFSNEQSSRTKALGLQ